LPSSIFRERPPFDVISSSHSASVQLTQQMSA
jgi:hypothetical protein